MDESKWVCERCGREYDLEIGDGWITLAETKLHIITANLLHWCRMRKFAMNVQMNCWP